MQNEQKVVSIPYRLATNGMGSIPGQTVDLNEEDWFNNVVWQAEINLNLKKVGDELEKIFRSFSTGNSDSNSGK